MAEYVLENNILKVTVDSKGCEIRDVLCKTDNTHRMWNANPEGWKRVAPVLFPLIGKYKDNQSIYNGKVYEMGQHGFARDMEFTLVEHNDGMLVMRLESDENTKEKYPFDFIILSIHQVEDKEFWTGEFQEGRTQQEYNERYYEELLNVVKSYKNYSVLGHPDLIVRYDEQGVYPFEKVKPIITEILKIVIADGKGIEFNTSYHRYGLKNTTPSIDILKLYKELGGEIITIGSDSHKPEHLGAYIDEAKGILKEIGFTRFCTFEKMKPIFYEL